MWAGNYPTSFTPVRETTFFWNRLLFLFLFSFSMIKYKLTYFLLSSVHSSYLPILSAYSLSNLLNFSRSILIFLADINMCGKHEECLLLLLNLTFQRILIHLFPWRMWPCASTSRRLIKTLLPVTLCPLPFGQSFILSFTQLPTSVTCNLIER